MKRDLLGATTFLAAFAVACIFTMPFVSERASYLLTEHTANEGPNQAACETTLQDATPEFSNFYIDDHSDFSSGNLIDLTETGNIYRESEVVAKNGEQWLGLFEKNGQYSLIKSKVKVNRLKTISYAGEDRDVDLTFSNGREPIFAVRNIEGVEPGPVTTLYHRPPVLEIYKRNLPISPIEKGYKRHFVLHNKWYTLRVSHGVNADGERVAVLVLEDSQTSQVIAQTFHEPGGLDRIGELYWVGDLDNDGKLDLYFDEFNEKGYFFVKLYLSSAARPGQSVGLAATFGMAGC